MFFYIYEKQYLSKHDICVVNAAYMRRTNFSARRTVTFHPCVFPVWQNRTRLSMVLPIPYVRRSVLSPRDQEKRRQIISLYGFPVRVHRSGGNDTVSRVLSSLIYRRECDTIPRACDTVARVRDIRNLPMIQIPLVSFSLGAGQIARYIDMKSRMILDSLIWTPKKL